MKKFNRIPNSGRSSKATSSTLCQKCLKKGHYSYECKAATHERPYISRPSRTQQLLNPNLVPKLSNEVPHDLLIKKGIADEQLAKLEEERGGTRETHIREHARGSNLRRTHSIPSSSSSVSTISTRLSLSPEPPPEKVSTSRDSHNRSSLEESSSFTRHRKFTRARSPSRQQSPYSSRRKRNRHHSMNISSPTSDDDYRSSKRNSTRKRTQSINSSLRDKNSRSKSPHRSQNFSNLHNRGNPEGGKAHTSTSFKEDQVTSPHREKSLSPFSKRLALTKALNMNR
ncbi:hypothetical protein OnM2_015025 [Erysiphe neolycopersici]|uniref:Zinc knuckle-domain-containing protein n=1 Tax=Erysiphe neolycopersici TaxID=212602 RepID=A0A420I5E9_9PEZI|nr:hypothetical protein OnM2_015025 [Erysiphe neolycopersici]